MPWESFRADIEAVVLTPEDARKSNAGRKPIDAIAMFRMLVLQSLYNFSTSRSSIRFAIGYVHSFLGLGLEDSIPDGTTLWLSGRSLPRPG